MASSNFGVEYDYYDVLVSSNSEKINGLMQWVDNQQRLQAEADARGYKILVGGFAGAISGGLKGASTGGLAGAITGGAMGFMTGMLKSLIVEIFV